MMTYLCLHHGRPLSAKVADGLEHVNNTLILHTLKHLTQGDENPSATHTRTENKNIPFRCEKFTSMSHLHMTNNSSFLAAPIGVIKAVHLPLSYSVDHFLSASGISCTNLA